MFDILWHRVVPTGASGVDHRLRGAGFVLTCRWHRVGANGVLPDRSGHQGGGFLPDRFCRRGRSPTGTRVQAVSCSRFPVGGPGLPPHNHPGDRVNYTLYHPVDVKTDCAWIYRISSISRISRKSRKKLEFCELKIALNPQEF